MQGAQWAMRTGPSPGARHHPCRRRERPLRARAGTRIQVPEGQAFGRKGRVTACSRAGERGLGARAGSANQGAVWRHRFLLFGGDYSACAASAWAGASASKRVTRGRAPHTICYPGQRARVFSSGRGLRPRVRRPSIRQGVRRMGPEAALRLWGCDVARSLGMSGARAWGKEQGDRCLRSPCSWWGISI